MAALVFIAYYIIADTSSVEIQGSPMTLDLLSRVLQEQQNTVADVPNIEPAEPSCSYTPNPDNGSRLETSEQNTQDAHLQR